MRKLLFLAAVVMIPLQLLATHAFGHSLYIQSGRHQVSQGKASPLFFCYGHHIPVDDAIRRKKLSYVRVILPDGSTQDIALRDEKSLHSYIVNYETPGTYVLTAETTPGFFTMWYDKKDRKRHSIKPMSAVADKASRIERSLRSSQWAKSYVACKSPSEVFPANVGLPLELVPEQDVFGLKPKDTLAIQVFKDGKPYVGQGYYDATYNGFSSHAEDMYIPRSEVTGGHFEIPVDVAGRWFVRFFTKTPPAADKQTEYLQEKQTTTLVFEVMGERKRPKIDGH